VLTDIEDRKRAEESLRANEGTLRKIINTLPVTAWSTLPDGYCDFFSQRWLEYAGFSAEQAEGCWTTKAAF
jgi:PAS domain-containing protein